jgi:ribonuclease Z
LLRTKLSLHRLRSISITHIHGDHCYGLPGLLASAGMNGRAEPLFIVAPKGIAEWISATIFHTQLHLPYELEFVATESLCDFRAGHFMVTATELSHRVPSYGYTFTEVRVDSRLNVEKLDADGIPRGPLWGEIKKGVDVEYEGRILRSSDYLLFDNKPRKIVIGGDNDRPELLADACRECDVLVHEATYTAEVAKKSGESFGHSSAEQVAAFAEAVSIPNLILTHFSARYQADPAKAPSIDDIRKEAAAIYKGSLFLAKDFANYKLQKSGEVSLVASHSPMRS